MQRTEPFTQVIVPPEIPDDPEAIDLKGIYLGKRSWHDWCEPLMGQHVLVAGASGSGKNSVTWMYLRALAPLISEGLVRIWVGQPEGNGDGGGSSRSATASAPRQPTSPRLIHEFWSTMGKSENISGATGHTLFYTDTGNPARSALIDELAALTAYSDSKIRRRIDGAFPLILSQARSWAARSSRHSKSNQGGVARSRTFHTAYSDAR